jgi:cysteine-rich repeat protein
MPGRSIVMLLALSLAWACTTRFHEKDDGEVDGNDAVEGNDGNVDGTGEEGECGNGVVESREECDDGNTRGGDGCESDCRFSCHFSSDCDDGNACNGMETCAEPDAAGRSCREGTAPGPGAECDDGLFCTAVDRCDASRRCVGEGNPCPDTVPCADEVCDEDVDRCMMEVHPGSCLIDDTCFESGERSPAGTCLVCDPANPEAWSRAPEGNACDDGESCTFPDTCNADGVCAGAALASPVGAISICTGPYHSCGVFAGGVVRCWGSGDFCGDGDPGTDKPAPVDVVGLGGGVRMVACGDYHTCALAASGDVLCWGDNGMGQLGTGLEESSPVPAAVAGLGAGAVSVSSSARHACAALVDGSVHCWGENANGVLGRPPAELTMSRLPVPLDLPTGASAGDVSSGSSFACALLLDRTVLCWGANFYSQLGRATETDWELVPSPVTVDSDGMQPLENVHSIACGAFHACAVADAWENGLLFCWGYNYSGQLGFDTGIRDSRSYATPVVAIVDPVRQASAGGAHTCAATEDGDALCWGSDSSGQLGDGTPGEGRWTPESVRIALDTVLTDVTLSAAGNTHSCAYSESMWTQCWGDNEYGQLGNDDHGVDSAFAVTVHCR